MKNLHNTFQLFIIMCSDQENKTYISSFRLKVSFLQDERKSTPVGFIPAVRGEIMIIAERTYS